MEIQCIQRCVIAKISYDCGIHAIVNAFLIINRLPFLSDIPSQKNRNYVRHILCTSNVEDAKFEALEKQHEKPKVFRLASGKVKIAKLSLIYSSWLSVSVISRLTSKASGPCAMLPHALVTNETKSRFCA